MSEKTKNRAAVLTAVTLFCISMVWFPVIGVCYLSLLWIVAITSEDFPVLAIVASPILVTYFVFLALLEHKKVISYCKTRYKEIQHALF